jgi:hypothetical protein
MQRTLDVPCRAAFGLGNGELALVDPTGTWNRARSGQAAEVTMSVSVVG